MQNTNKIHIQHLAEICAQKGMEQVVLSPGSRCAPLVIAFNRHASIKCYTIVDERSAAFFALGLAQQSGKPVGLVCTSGSAVLNYAPAVAEAFYQKVPLVLMTADRPNEWIDQGENQSIQQFEVFKNYIKKSYQLPVTFSEDKDVWFSNRIVSEAINTAKFPDLGPVHINIPLREPLYDLTDESIEKPKIVDLVKADFSLVKEEMEALENNWNQAKKKLIIVGGQKQKNTAIEKALQLYANNPDVVILKESISNIETENAFAQIDPLIELIQKNKLAGFVPDVILTFGNGVVSKKLKFWLRHENVMAHWHISSSYEHWDNFQALTKVLKTNVAAFLTSIHSGENKDSNYFELWNSLNNKISNFTEKYIQESDFADFKVFQVLSKNFPKNANIQFGNSTPVRYANLVELNAKLLINANRGVSGIDGQVSTALGASNINNKLTVCITGDLAMMYDSNAFWNNYLHPNFKVILINNNGGNIFRIIPGPNKLDELETYFETKNTYEAKHLANLHGLKYFQVKQEADLEATLDAFYAENEQAALLEINTNGTLSADILKNYFVELVKAVK
ncbi:MAG: 2-succinyl-5-enolpyruvyl-6-hydroxy-3-cyclohexene-1-carboxylate synthase [Planctomycetota bacterium]